ncbi:SAV_6107 family HEPN domain-containing protein [Actinophytocola sp.]|uniref:SAV_6107 family HEPN domain-containing protein n=1 Tax=Actinophytocola sp. TaxID=1872138 RepID=UPI003D6A4D02
MTTTLDYRDNEPLSVPEPALTLLSQAERGLADAEVDTEPAQRFAQAYLAALRAAAALLAMRGRPHRARSRPMSVWTLLASVAPELREWAAFFASCSSTRASVQAGITRAVTARSADDLVRQSGQFLGLVTRAIHGSTP